MITGGEPSYFDTLTHLLVAAFTGGIIGLERERNNQPAGLRTHIILCVGSALIMIVSVGMAYGHPGFSTIDPTRIAAQVVSGIGFLGAGAIIRLGVSIKGLTTAASLWTTAGLGLAIGAGMYFPAIVATGLMLVTLSYLSKIEKRMRASKGERRIMISFQQGKESVHAIQTRLIALGLEFVSLQINRDKFQGMMEVEAVCMFPPTLDPGEVTSEILKFDTVREVEIQ